jgi:hypothetical protein
MSKLAQVVEVADCSTITEVLSKSNTAWEPQTARVTGLATGTVTSDFHAIIRPDTNQTLGICTKRYKPNSHVVHLARLDNMVRHGDLKPERVSIWDHGMLLAYQFRAPVLDAEILPGDSVSPLLTLAFYNDGKHGDMSFFADFRWACTNQLGRVAAAMEGKKRTAHRGDVHGNYEKAMTDRISEMSQQARSRYEAMKKMAQKDLTNGDNILFFWQNSLDLRSNPARELMGWNGTDDLSSEAKQLQQVLGCYREDPTNAPGTVWQAYNAVTRYLTHNVGRNAATRSRRALMGTYDQLQQKAFEEGTRLAA